MALSLLDLMVTVRTTGVDTLSSGLIGIEKQAARTDKAVGSSFRSIGSSMTRVGAGLSVAVTLPLVAMGAAAIKTGAQYEQALQNAVSVTGKTGAAADAVKAKMNDLALTLGEKTAFSAQDAATAMYDLASSGWSVKQMQDGLNGIMALAAATQTDLAAATKVVVSAISQYGLKASDSGRVSDVFTAAINKTRVTMDDLGVAMNYVGPVAAAMGMSLEETTAALSLMANAGIESSTAGTSLRAALANLANPIGQTSKALKAMGIAEKDVNPATNSLSDILTTLKSNGLDAKDAMMLFGREGGPAMLALAKQGVPALDNLTKSLKNSGGTAERTAKYQLNTLAGAWEQLKGSLETAAIRLEQQVAPALKAVVLVLVPAVNWFSRLSAPVKVAVIAFAAFAAALGPLLVAAGLVATAIGGIATAFATLSPLLASVSVFAAPIAAVVVGLAVAGILLYKNWSSVAPLFQRVAAAFRNAFKVVQDIIAGGFADNFSRVQDAISKLPKPLQSLAAKIAIFANKLGDLGTKVKTFVQIFVAAFSGNFTRVQELISRLPTPLQRAAAGFAMFGDRVRQVAQVAFKFFQAQAAFVLKWFKDNWPLIQRTAVTVINVLIARVRTGFNVLKAIVMTAVRVIVAFWKQNHTQITNIAQAAWTVIKTIIKTAIRVVLGIIKAVMQAITGNWKGAWNTMNRVLQTAWNAIKTLIKSSLSIIKNLIQIAWNTVKKLTQAAWEAVKGYIVDKFSAAKDRVKSIAQDLASALKSKWEDIKSGAKSAWEAIKGFIVNPVKDAYEGVKEWISNILDLVNQVLEKVGLKPIGGLDKSNPSKPQPSGGGGGAPKAFAKGGLGTKGKEPRMHVWNEQQGNEAYIAEREPTRTQLPYLKEAARWHGYALTPVKPPHESSHTPLRMADRTGRPASRFYRTGGLVRSKNARGANTRPAPAPASANASGSGSGPQGDDLVKAIQAKPPWPGVPVDYVARIASYVADTFGVSDIGGYRPSDWASEHSTGRALDIMTYSDMAKGSRIADWSVSNAGPLGLKWSIFNQRINTGQGWQGMEDRGSPTQNHVDHVHDFFTGGPGGGGGFPTTGGGGFGGGFSVPNPVQVLFEKLWGSLVKPVVDTFLKPLENNPYVMMQAVGAGARKIPKGIYDWIDQKIPDTIGGSPGGGGGSDPLSGGGQPAANRALGQKAAEQTRNWVGSQWSALDAIWQAESGWDNNAQNPTSTAYGIPQFLDCLTLDADILTRDGFKSHDEVRLGDETLGYNPATGHLEWTRVLDVVHHDEREVVEIGNSRWHARVTPGHRWISERRATIPTGNLTVCSECGKVFPSVRAASNHRTKAHGVYSAGPSGYYAVEELVRTEDITKAHKLRLSALADTESTVDITPDEAALIGWIVSEGHIGKKGGGLNVAIYQSKPEQVAVLEELLEGIPHSRYTRERNPGKHLPAHQFYLHAGHTRDLLQRSSYEDPEAFVLSLDGEQRARFLEAVIQAEGSPTPHSGGLTWRIYQNEGPWADAFALAVYLEGNRPTRKTRKRRVEHHADNVAITVADAFVHGASLEQRSIGKHPVWCVRTGLGTWTARQDEQVMLTGNSTWSSTGISKTSDPGKQIEAGMRYIEGRYDDPVGAKSFRDSAGYYSEGGLIKREHFANVHPNELYLPLDNAQVHRAARTALGTTELRAEIAELRRVVEGGIAISEIHEQPARVIIAGTEARVREATTGVRGARMHAENRKGADRDRRLMGAR